MDLCWSSGWHWPRLEGIGRGLHSLRRLWASRMSSESSEEGSRLRLLLGSFTFFGFLFDESSARGGGASPRGRWGSRSRLRYCRTRMLEEKWGLLCTPAYRALGEAVPSGLDCWLGMGRARSSDVP